MCKEQGVQGTGCARNRVCKEQGVQGTLLQGTGCVSVRTCSGECFFLRGALRLLSSIFVGRIFHCVLCFVALFVTVCEACFLLPACLPACFFLPSLTVNQPHACLPACLFFSTFLDSQPTTCLSACLFLPSLAVNHLPACLPACFFLPFNHTFLRSSLARTQLMVDWVVWTWSAKACVHECVCT